MPDATAAPEAPKFTPKEVLQHGDSTEKVSGITPEQTERLAALKKIKEDGKSGKEGLQMAAGETQETSFGTLQVNALLLKFGAGEVVEDATGTVTEKSTANPAEKASLERMRKAAEKASAFLQYSSILAESERTGEKIDKVIKERVKRGDTSVSSVAEYNRQRAAGLDALLSSGYIKRLYPELGDSSTAIEARRKLLEATLGKEIGLRSKIATDFREITQRAQSLPEVIKDEDLKTSEKEKGEEDAKVNIATDKILKSVETDIGAPLDPADKQRLMDAIANGSTPEQILRTIRQITVEKVNHYADFAKRGELKTRVDEAFAKWNQGKAPTTMNKNAQPNQTAIDAANKLYDQFEKLEDEYNTLEETINQNRADFDRFQDLDRRYSIANSASTEIGVLLNSLYASQNKSSELDRKIQDKKNNPNNTERDSRNTRLQAEADLADEMENIFSEAAQEVLTKRYDEMAELEAKRLEKKKKEEGETDDVKIEEAMGKNWIEYNRNSKSKDVHGDKIQKDMKFIAYKGEDGIKRLIMRDLDLKIPRLAADGTPVINTTTNQPVVESTRILYEDFDMKRLSPEQKTRVDALYAKFGDKYRDKLMTDHFASQTFLDKAKGWIPGTDKFGLQKHEWEALELNFSGKLSSAFERSGEVRGVLKSLEESGIKPTAKTKLAVFALLALLLGLGTASLTVPAAAAAASGIRSAIA